MIQWYFALCLCPMTLLEGLELEKESTLTEFKVFSTKESRKSHKLRCVHDSDILVKIQVLNHVSGGEKRYNTNEQSMPNL